jgi:hypothetical protein
VPRSRERMATVYPSEANLRDTAEPSRGAMPREEVDPDTDLSIWGEREVRLGKTAAVPVSSFEPRIVGFGRKTAAPSLPPLGFSVAF